MVELNKLSTEKIKEMSLIDLCYTYMVEEDIEKLNIYDFLDYIKPLRNVDDEEFSSQAAYFYTDLNLDGRFVCVEDGSWKLRDNLLVEDIKNFVEPSVQKFEIEDEDMEELIEDEEQEDVHDEVDDLIEDEDMEENEDVYDFDNEGIVSKFNIKSEEEEF
ncbi:DNA-directed RNA polymerase subunit delta [Gemella cuniculi]|uniref:DNA-directed RNA polymerase subunit delta n=1 Tax=Gemella cuniculi TaxID=150240 RepID=UPI0003F5C792|nr:DNA-directed RNA polymerase subunit delta [Gemella cuniculi]